MNDFKLTPDELNKLPKELLVSLYLQMSENFALISSQNQTIQSQNEQLLRQIEDLREQLAIQNQNRFGRKTEANQVQGQLCFDLENGCVLNEAEFLIQDGIQEETHPDKVIRRRTSGKREVNLQNIETETIDHECTEDELNEKFPKGWHALQDEVYKELKYIPGTFKVLEHHVKIYAGNHGNGGVLRASAPARLLSHSILTPELAAAVFNAKYVNGIPLNRLSQEFQRNDVNIPRQDMAGWMIRLYDYYLGPVHDRMKQEILRSTHVNCDETPFKMPEHTKEYMWVFHSPGGVDALRIYLYEYLGGRNGAVIEEYLKGYKGILITDGYQPYHSLMKKGDGIRVAGCWAHARRKFCEIVKAAGKNKKLTPAETAASEAVKRIDAMYHLDNAYKDSSAKERLDNRNRSIRPLVDAYFAWVKQMRSKTCSSTKLTEALKYSANQEPYLRVFLDDPEVPLDNNAAERSIRSFCVGKHNWQIIDSIKGAKASAMLYSIAETAKANNLKTYDYFAYLLTQLMQYPRGNVPMDVLTGLMPWSPELPDRCRQIKQG